MRQTLTSYYRLTPAQVQEDRIEVNKVSCLLTSLLKGRAARKMEPSGYRRNPCKTIMYNLGCVLTLGLLLLITRLKPRWRLLLTHSRCPICEADVVLPEDKRVTTVPGFLPRDTASGNLKDMREHGSFQAFLANLHDRFGPIASFYFGPQLTISICTPQLFKQQLKVFDRPPVLFEMLKPLLGAASIQFTNGPEGRTRHAAYRRCFSDNNVAKFFNIFQKLSDDIIDKWENVPNQEHINLQYHMDHFAMRVILNTAFGSYFEVDERVEELRRCHNYCWRQMESVLVGDAPKEGSEEQKQYEKHKATMCDIIQKAATFHRQHRDTTDAVVPLFVDVVDELNLAEDAAQNDMLTMLVGGFQNTALLLTWAIYYLARYQHTQEAMYNEIKEKWVDGPLTMDIVKSMTYAQQVIDETLRCTTSGYTARVQDTDIELGGHVIPAGTPVLQALCVSWKNHNIFPNPELFDPERFSAANKASRPSLSFEPFGFAGKRKCPGEKLSLAESKVFLIKLLHKFKVDLVPGLEVSKMYVLFPFPDKDIWITVRSRV